MRKLNLPGWFGYWIAGFADGDGTFYIKAKERDVNKKGKIYHTREISLSFAIGLRDDDAHVLRLIQKILKCGKISQRSINHSKWKSNPYQVFSVRKTSDLVQIIVPLFEQHSLRTKKAQEFELWKQAVWIRQQSIETRKTKGTRSGHLLPDTKWNQVKQLEKQIRIIRAYKGSS